MRPFLKWPGGKRWLAERINDLYEPTTVQYLEPFFGGGAVFFFLEPKRALLSDVNAELIVTYEGLRDRPDLVLRYLREHQSLHSRAHYYKVRSSRPRSAAAVAARMIYLNRTCFNGIYRVNRGGEFNVPIGTRSSIVRDEDQFIEIAKALSGSHLRQCDFEEAMKSAARGSFIYVDPPYTVLHNNNDFRRYNENIFRWEDQCRLARVAAEANARGAFVVISNANHPAIRELYSDFGKLEVVSRLSLISGSKVGRRVTEELLIVAKPGGRKT